LMTQAAFDIARRAVVGSKGIYEDTTWMAHGPYLLKGCEDPVAIFEVGVRGVSPLAAPPDSQKAKRSVAAGDEETLGWRPAAGQRVPQRKAWTLEQKLGEGGFGEVWLATHERTKSRRVFKFCFDADRLRSLKRELTLFRLLRDALGDRKDIARLFDVQLDEAPFFLESEFTPSGSLVEWAEEQGGLAQVPLDLRIGLVAQTARAVAAAHSVGILHKDIKPANILIYQDDDMRPRPRLADFGIGAITERGQLEGRNITVAGFTDPDSDTSSHAGTRMYAPPESLAGRPFTVLGDVYALGVMLYQMVVGDLERPVAQGWERDVPHPLLREDIAVCIDGNEEQRLGSAQGLAKRLEALPERRRQYGRRRAAVVAFGTLVALVILGSIATVWGVRESGLRGTAELQRDRAQTMNQMFEDLLLGAVAWDSGDTRDIRVVDLLDHAAPALVSELEGKLELQAEFQAILGRSYRYLDANEKARPHLQSALEIRERLFERPREEIAESLVDWAELQWNMGAYTEAEPFYVDALRMRETLARVEPDDPARQLALAESKQLRASWLNRAESAEAAEDLYREALAIRRTYLTPPNRHIARSENNLGFCLLRQNKYAEAQAPISAALAQFLALSPRDPETGEPRPTAEVAGVLNNLGRCEMELGRHDVALDLLREAVAMKRAVWGDAHGSIAVSLHYLGVLHQRRDEPAAAVPILEEALSMRERLLGPDHPDAARTAVELGGCRLALDAVPEAHALLLRGYEVLRTIDAAEPERIRRMLTWLIETSRRLDRADEQARFEAELARE
ncbi:MAG: tetratricopeptide repeat protein, partial [Phycisphaerales bacterium]|nr:tetratricopeptide repeat protein [Phycisphaerales bacterium]